MVVSHLPAGSQVGELCDEVEGVRQDPTGEHHHVQGDLDCAVPRPAVRYDMICLVPSPAVLTRQSFLILLRIVKIIKIVKIVKTMRFLRDIKKKTSQELRMPSRSLSDCKSILLNECHGSSFAICQ